ncbi:DUF4166 domain-containing protein [Sphaerisporangium album]|nr:DUF4166 domain-containing protein [Sphaerisporangium album]
MYRFHLGDETVGGTGVLAVRRGPGLLGRIACALLRLPATCTAVPARVRVVRTAGPADRPIRERWVRHVGARELVTVQTRAGERGWERHGPLEIRTRTIASAGTVEVIQEDAVLRAGHREVRLPAPLAPRVAAYAWIAPEDRPRRPPRFHVRVQVTLPFIGRLLAYEGHLTEEPRPRVGQRSAVRS